MKVKFYKKIFYLFKVNNVFKYNTNCPLSGKRSTTRRSTTTTTTTVTTKIPTMASVGGFNDPSKRIFSPNFNGRIKEEFNGGF